MFWSLKFEIYLEFGIWSFEFARWLTCPMKYGTKLQE